MSEQRFYPGERVFAVVESRPVPAEVHSPIEHPDGWLYNVVVEPGYLKSTHEAPMRVAVWEKQIERAPAGDPWPSRPPHDPGPPEHTASTRPKPGLGCLVVLAALLFLAGTGAGLWLGAAVSFASRFWS